MFAGRDCTRKAKAGSMPLNSEETDMEGPTPIRRTLAPHYIFSNEASEMTLKKRRWGMMDIIGSKRKRL